MSQGSTVSRYFFPLLLGLAIALPAYAAKDYHLWYDESGQAVYSQFAPEDGTPTERVKQPPPPAESPEMAQKRLQDQMQKSADFFEDKELASKEAAQTEQVTKQNEERCAAARKNLQELTGPPNRLYRQSDGSYKRWDEEQREKQREEMEKIIAESCR